MEERAGLRVIVEAWDGVAGSRWTATVNEHLPLVNHVLVVVSPHYTEAGAQQTVWQAAFDADPGGRGPACPRRTGRGTGRPAACRRGCSRDVAARHRSAGGGRYGGEPARACP
ncbi:hypothetical protein FRACA_1970004 [Frankia canadensis]|uniref:TIR domain-containing protein n=1 Tax=Frankia canadensis TaxID=1836972 RepID=A0A2I2KPH9_9ACTN|nr:hypothetical protein FRACA_1970004 [Frankia canadensis]SOU54867.1 hypothetical protein FRACA_1970004 [Frankia canadensis]